MADAARAACTRVTSATTWLRVQDFALELVMPTAMTFGPGCIGPGERPLDALARNMVLWMRAGHFCAPLAPSLPVDVLQKALQ